MTHRVLLNLTPNPNGRVTAQVETFKRLRDDFITKIKGNEDYHCFLNHPNLKQFVNLTDQNNDSPFSLLIDKDPLPVDEIKFLISKGADPIRGFCFSALFYNDDEQLSIINHIISEKQTEASASLADMFHRQIQIILPNLEIDDLNKFQTFLKLTPSKAKKLLQEKFLPTVRHLEIHLPKSRYNEFNITRGKVFQILSDFCEEDKCCDIQ